MVNSALDEPLRALAASNCNRQTAAHPKSPWVCRGYRPGTHITSAHLRSKLKPVLAALEARLGTLNELTQTSDGTDRHPGRGARLPSPDARSTREGVSVDIRAPVKSPIQIGRPSASCQIRYSRLSDEPPGEKLVTHAERIMMERKTRPRFMVADSYSLAIWKLTARIALRLETRRRCGIADADN